MVREKLHFGRYDFAAFSAFNMYSVCSFSIPLLIVAIGRELAFPLDDGGMAAGGMLHLIRSAAMMISLLLCGWIAAAFGKRVTLGAAVMAIGAGIFACGFAPAYGFLIPALLAAGTGEGICEGILTPFVQDLHPESPERYVNLSHAFWSTGIVMAVLLCGGALACGMSWRIILCLIGLLTILSGTAFFRREDPAHPAPEAREGVPGAEVPKKIRAIIRSRRFWRCCLAMFFGAGAEFGLTFWAAAYIELTFQTSALAAGVGTGIIALGMFIGRTGFGCIARQGNLRRILLGSSLGTIPAVLLLAALRPGTMPPAALAVCFGILLLLCGIGIAPYWPTTQVYGVLAMPELDPTMLYVLFSATGIPGCGFFAWFMGAAGDRWGITGALLVVPVCLLIFAAVVFVECRLSGSGERQTEK